MRIESDKIVFSPTLDKHGVQIVPDKQIKLANQMAKSVGRKILITQGNFECVEFFFDQEISEEETEQLQENFVNVE